MSEKKVEFRNITLCKLDKKCSDRKTIKKVINEYYDDIDHILKDLLKEKIFTNGISEAIEKKLDKIMKDGTKNK